jgi:arsenate reductase
VSDRVLFHNPSCSKSRGALEILTEQDVDFETVEYLTEPVDRATLERIVALLPDDPADLVRKDKNFKSLGLDAADYTDAESVVALLLAHPELMQRPVFVAGERAIIGRPSENVLELL